MLNDSSDLSFRDFKIASSLAKSLKIKVLLLQGDENELTEDSGIIFTTMESFMKIRILIKLHAILPNTFIIDEFNSLVLSNSERSNIIIQTMSEFSPLIALSGSDLHDFHRQFIERELLGRHFQVKSRGIERNDPLCLDKLLAPTVK